MNSVDLDENIMSEHVGKFAKLNIHNEFLIDTVLVVSFDKDDTNKLLVMFVEDINAQGAFLVDRNGVDSNQDCSPMFFINKKDLLFYNGDKSYE